MPIRSLFRCVAPLVALFAVNCAVEESVEPDVGSVVDVDAYDSEPIFEMLAENDPSLVCCCLQIESQCSYVNFGGRRDCRASPYSGCMTASHSRVEANNRRDIIVDGCPVWEVIDPTLTQCISGPFPDTGPEVGPDMDVVSEFDADVSAEADGDAETEADADADGSAERDGDAESDGSAENDGSAEDDGSAESDGGADSDGSGGPEPGE